MRSHGHASAGLGQQARRDDAQSNSPGISSAAAGAWTSRLLPPLLAIACAAAVGRYHSAYGRVPARVRDAYTYNSSRVLSAARPAAVLFENVVHADEALHLINASRSGRMEPAYVAKAAGPFGLGGVTKASSQRRSNTLHWMPHDDSPEIWALVQRIAAIVGIPSTHAERLQVIRYEPGQEYAGHVDGYEGDLAAAHPAGQRLVSTIVYLTSVAKGGGTEIAGRVVAAEQGRMLLFHNTAAGTNELDPSTRHAGLPVIAGEKWACNLWFHEFEVSESAEAAQRAKAKGFPDAAS